MHDNGMEVGDGAWIVQCAPFFSATFARTLQPRSLLYAVFARSLFYRLKAPTKKDSNKCLLRSIEPKQGSEPGET